MNVPQKLPLPDVQARVDSRQLKIDSVGVKGLRYPVIIRSNGIDTSSIANINMSVGLSAAVKGTHMSRFVEVLEANVTSMDNTALMEMAGTMVERLNAEAGKIEMRFPYFIQKTAPVSKVQSLLDIEVSWRARIDQDGAKQNSLQVIVPATSLCPCSRDISAYGAHNQRSLISITVVLAQAMSIEELVAIAESSASCEVYGLLKRVDEKYVTERAYENPKFVEDMVRDVALALNRHSSVLSYEVEVENFESIHNHSAVARIVSEN
ncbi:GTP cyclohydrolase FolE2 [Undibacterium sp. Di27W]|uniref:GTP cyclohydrolase FolE2 n=1 Tax=Undibacterium sp. Di27W TaxID=3413036 RepID=UPI003BF39889